MKKALITGVTGTIPQGFGLLVESTSTDHTYTFHRLVPKATEVTTVASNITNIVFYRRRYKSRYSKTPKLF